MIRGSGRPSLTQSLDRDVSPFFTHHRVFVAASLAVKVIH